MANTILKKLLLVIILISIGSIELFAHPHMKVLAYSYNYFNDDWRHHYEYIWHE